MVMLVSGRLRLGNGTEKKVQQASEVPCIPLANRDTPHWSSCVARPVSLAPGLNPWGPLLGSAPKGGFQACTAAAWEVPQWSYIPGGLS